MDDDRRSNVEGVDDGAAAAERWSDVDADGMSLRERDLAAKSLRHRSPDVEPEGTGGRVEPDEREGA